MTSVQKRGTPGPILEDDIRRLLDLFYSRVRDDPQLGPVFANAIGTSDADWARHVALLTDFWSSVILRSGRYHGDPFSAHLRLPDLEPAMFDRWLELFGGSCAEVLEPDAADAFRGRASQIARSLRMGLAARMARNDDGTDDDGISRIREYSSPACIMHELDDAVGPAKAPAMGAAEDWKEVRLWRKAKRTVLIERRLAMSAAERTAHSAAITASLAQVLPSQPGALIGFYWPFKGEYDARALARSLHAQGMRLALPVVLQKRQPVIFREWWPGIAMASGMWNIPIPAEGEPVAPSVLLIPVVGFDRRNFRLGYGGGYYDRTLAAASIRPRTIGVGFELSQIATIHSQPHDIAMDQVVTERRI